MNTILWFFLTALSSPYLLLTAKKQHTGRRKILIIQWAKLGDMVCTTPMFRAIKTAHPEWDVHVLCRDSNRIVIKNNPCIDRLVSFDGRRGALIQRLRGEGYDTVINCLPGSFWSMLGLWLGAPDRINTSSSNHGHIIRWSRIFNTVNRSYAIGTRTFDHYLELLAPLGVPRIPYALDFVVSDEDAKVAQAWMQKHHLRDGSFVVFNVSAGNAIKEWPEEKFAALADRMSMPVVLSTLDAAKIARIRALVKNPQNVIDASALPLGLTAAICKAAKAFVAGDTGPLYVAYAAGASIVVLVGGSDVREQIPPAGLRVRHVLPPKDCTPWMHVTLSPRTATPEQLRCVRDTSEQAVYDAVSTLISKA